MAIVTALLVVALAATLAAGVAWRELVALRDVRNQRTAVELRWLERGAVEWARVVLREQARRSNVAFYGQRWSNPVRDIRLSSVLPRQALATSGELADAAISGWIEDAQAKFNLMNLASRAGPGQPWQVDGRGVAAYRRLLAPLAIDAGLAEATAIHIVRSLGAGSGIDGRPLQLVSLTDLARIPGYGPHAIAALSEVATLLPDYTEVNVNTASAAALMAAIPALDPSQAERLVERRKTAYFVSTADIALQLRAAGGEAALPDGALAAVNSGYFIVHCRIRSKRIDARVDTLIARYGIGNGVWTSVIWTRRAPG
ncbi:type II secretion system minor pseudopilin GspK [Trinickia caryophylli]|nr:type II secretion system minor pseudopilin GspK [Trinickia caryophylli]WQE12025.1 type II secretion system minor pseudopilin GspK [Trinickia caryophylli]GLU35581.1 general secretion pathway protein GspK [Trinickia caryophylli]